MHGTGGWRARNDAHVYSQIKENAGLLNLRQKADTACNASIVCADGLANGVSTYDEAVSILGEPAKTVDGENGAKEVLFNVLNSMKYTLVVNADGLVTGITIDGLL